MNGDQAHLVAELQAKAARDLPPGTRYEIRLPLIGAGRYVHWCDSMNTDPQWGRRTPFCVANGAYAVVGRFTTPEG